MTTLHIAENHLAGRSVASAMHRGVLTASPEQPPRAVAALMADHGVHAIVGEDAPHTVMTDLDVIAAALAGTPSMRDHAGRALPVVGAADDLGAAAATLAAARATHALVVEGSPAPAGVLSAWDVCAVAAGYEPDAVRRRAAFFPQEGTGRLEHLTVEAVMHPGVLAVGPTVAIRDVAVVLAERRIHAVAIAGVDEANHLVWAFATVADVLEAAVHGDLLRHASEAAATEPVVVDAVERLDVAAARLVEHDVTHAIAVGSLGIPEGVLSTLDVLRVLGQEEGP